MNSDYWLTEEGYQKALEKLEKLKEEYAKNEVAMSKSIQDATGDGAHDNGEFESLLAKEKFLVSQINLCIKQIASASIIEIPVLEKHQVNIGGKVLLKIIYDQDDFEIDTYELVGGDADANLQQISINSPIGKAIFGRSVGDKIPYLVGDNTFYVEILEKMANNS